MAQRRISRGTPLILSESEVAATLTATTPRVEMAIAALLNMTVEAWRAQPKRVRVKQIIEFQNTGALAASLAAAEKAVGDLEAAAMPTIAPAPTEDVVEQVLDALHRRGLLVVNPTHAKGA